MKEKETKVSNATLKEVTCSFFSGSKRTNTGGHHDLNHENSTVYNGRGTAGKVHPARNNLHKNAFLQAIKKKEIAKNEWLVKELALSSDIGEAVTRSKASKKNKKVRIPVKVHHEGKTLGNKRASKSGSPTKNTKSQKRTSISFPSNLRGPSLPEDGAPLSRTLLTAISLLLDEKNHFQKDINALTLAKVLSDDASKDETNDTSDPHNEPTSLGAISNVLGLLNATVSKESPRGERKSTIHTELINPTELGISILKLLFGHKAPLVVKPTYKPSFRYTSTAKTESPVAKTVLTHARLAAQMNEFANGKETVRKKYHRNSFTFALAKAVSDLIRSMAKRELKKYLQKIHNQHKLFNEMHYRRIPTKFWPWKKTVDVQGDRKSWVLLKIPKSGDEETLSQEMSDELQDEKPSNEGKSLKGIVDTIGKLNKADLLSSETPGKDTGDNSLSGENSEIKVKPTSRVGYTVRILPSLKGSNEKQTSILRVKAKPAKNLNPQTTAAFAEAVKKLLQAVQSSIKSLQGKQFIGHPSEVPSIVSDQPSGISQQRVASIATDEPAKIPERTNTGSVRGLSSNPTSLNNLQYQKRPVLEDLQVKRQPSIGELSELTRATGQNDFPFKGNALFDPLRDLELAASESISKPVSPTKRIGPTDNVVFESDTELGTARDKQESSMVKHIKEGKFCSA